VKLAVMGTGGVGGYFGARFAEAGQDVTFIARGPHFAAIRERGLEVQSERGDVLVRPARATRDPAEVGRVDFVLFCVKLWDVEAAGEAIRPMVGPETAVIALQNGVDAEERLARILGPQPVMGGVAHISAVIKEPGVIRHTGKLARLFFGELGGGESARARAFLDACRASGIDAQLRCDIERVIWDKFIFLVAFSGMTALLRKPIGPLREDPEVWAMFTGAMREAADLAAAKGIAFERDQVEAWAEIAQGMPYEYRASMLEDLERGRRLELPWLSGAVARLGREFGLPTPINGFIATALKPYANP
jgi:2-dehydropantoate 2-reductase